MNYTDLTPELAEPSTPSPDTSLQYALNAVRLFDPNQKILLLKDSLVAKTGPNHYTSAERTYHPDELKNALTLESVYSLSNCIEAFPNEELYTLRDLVTYYANRK